MRSNGFFHCVECFLYPHFSRFLIFPTDSATGKELICDRPGLTPQALCFRHASRAARSNCRPASRAGKSNAIVLGLTSDIRSTKTTRTNTKSCSCHFVRFPSTPRGLPGDPAWIVCPVHVPVSNTKGLWVRIFCPIGRESGSNSGARRPSYLSNS